MPIYTDLSGPIVRSILLIECVCSSDCTLKTCLERLPRFAAEEFEYQKRKQEMKEEVLGKFPIAKWIEFAQKNFKRYSRL